MYSKKKRKKQRKNKKELNKGDLFYADLGAKFGSEQNGIRPVIIVQNDIGNKHGNTVIIVPLTSIIKGKLKQPTHSFICPIDNLKRYSIALAEQITTIHIQQKKQLHILLLDIIIQNLMIQKQ